MNTKKIIAVLFMGVISAGLTVYSAFYTQRAKRQQMVENNLLFENVEALSSNAETQTSNTGPGEMYDCPGIGTGDGKMCMCSNSYPCQQVLCPGQTAQ